MYKYVWFKYSPSCVVHVFMYFYLRYFHSMCFTCVSSKSAKRKKIKQEKCFIFLQNLKPFCKKSTSTQKSKFRSELFYMYCYSEVERQVFCSCKLKNFQQLQNISLNSGDKTNNTDNIFTPLCFNFSPCWQK